MNIREMHYDFKQKLNKIDSQKYKNLQVPEIDWKLNEAIEVFVKVIAEPRLKNGFGFEINQRSIDDIRSLVINQSLEVGNCLTASNYDNESYIVTLPEDYWFHISSEAYGSKNTCSGIRLDTKISQHDDRIKTSSFDVSSFEWRTVNIRFFEDGIRIFTDGTFSIESLCLDYIRKPIKVYNAQDHTGGSYRDLGTGAILTGSQDCDLPAPTHREIVDLAVLIATGDLQISDYQIKQNKLKLTN